MLISQRSRLMPENSENRVKLSVTKFIAVIEKLAKKIQYPCSKRLQTPVLGYSIQVFIIENRLFFSTKVIFTKIFFFTLELPSDIL